MIFRKTQNKETTFIETPAGIFTSAGNWFHTTESNLRSYAPGLFNIYTTGAFLRLAEVWIRSADNLTILLFFSLLLTTNLYIAALGSLFFLPFWHINKSAFTYPGVTKILRLLDIEFIILAIAVAALSIFGIQEQYYTLMMGFLFFFLFKFGWYRKLTDRVYHAMKPGIITLNDRLLRMMIVKYALKEGEHIEEIDKMERDILTLINEKQKKQNQKKKK